MLFLPLNPQRGPFYSKEDYRIKEISPYTISCPPPISTIILYANTPGLSAFPFSVPSHAFETSSGMKLFAENTALPHRSKMIMDKIFSTSLPPLITNLSFTPSPFGEKIFGTYISSFLSKDKVNASSSIHPSRLITVTEYVVVITGATGCVRHSGQLGLLSPLQVTDESESNGTLTIALMKTVSPGKTT